MVPKLSTPYMLECGSCQLRNHVKYSSPEKFELRHNYYFSIIHFDIRELCHVSSFGFRYFITSKYN